MNQLIAAAAGLLLVLGTKGALGQNLPGPGNLLPNQAPFLGYLNTGTISPSSVVSAPHLGLFINESVSGSCSSGCNYNYFAINSDNTAVGSGSSGTFSNGVGWNFNHNFGGALATGDRITGVFNFLLNQQTGNSALGASYGALAAYATATVNDNGTDTGSVNSRGQIEALNVVASLGASATNYRALQGAEIDISNLGSTYEKVGLQVTQLNTDAVVGATIDTALYLANQSGAVGWTNMILFGGGTGWPLASGGTAIACFSTCGTMASFIDMNGATISGNFLRSPGFSVNGTGAISGLSVNVTGSGIPVNGLYLPVANVPCLEANSNLVFCVQFGGGGVGAIATIGTTAAGINVGDKLAFASSVNIRTGSTFTNTNAGTATSVSVTLGNSNSAAQAALTLNGGSFSGGQGANALQISNTGAAPIVVGTGTEVVKFGSSGAFTANGAVVTALTGVGPTGSHTTVQKWFTITDSGGVVGYIPVFHNDNVRLEDENNMALGF